VMTAVAMPMIMIAAIVIMVVVVVVVVRGGHGPMSHRSPPRSMRLAAHERLGAAGGGGEAG
jgi:hypothetical protein